MNWSKIKTIMICFLFAMNLFMLAFIAVSSIRESSIPGEVITASAEVLRDSGFVCDEADIPSLDYNLPVLDAEFYSASELSEIFFGKQLAFRTVENSLVASEGKATLTVSGNYFQYENGYSADSSHSWRKIKRTLEKAGINMQGSVYDEKEKCFYLMYNNTNLFNMYIIAELDSDGEISTLRAQWPGALSVMEKRQISFVKSITDLKKEFPDGGKINAIEPGYSLRSLGGEKYVFMPSWRVNVNEELKIIG